MSNDKKKKKEFRCEDCGSMVEENAEQCPKCGAVFIDSKWITDEKEHKSLITKIDQLGNSWFDTFITFIEYLIALAYPVFFVIYFIIGLQGGFLFAVIFSLLGTIVFSLFLFEYTKIGYIIAFLLLIHKYIYHIQYLKIMDKKKQVYLEEEYLSKIEEIKKKRKQKRSIFLKIIIGYILYFIIALLFMKQIQSI